MLRFALVGLLLIHAAIHLMGWMKALDPAAVPQLSQTISKSWGVVWLITAVLLAISSGVLLFESSWWWMIALTAALLSQVCIFGDWGDAKAGTLINIVVVLGALRGWGDWRFERTTRELVERLDVGPGGEAEIYRESALSGLPTPVQTHLRKALRDGSPIVRHVEVRQSGTMNLSESGESWKKFRATQHVNTGQPGFVWAADVALFPGVSVKVHDAYVQRTGLLQPSFLGLISMARARDTGGEVSRGELFRFLAESLWYPTALLPGQGVAWGSVDDRHARATLEDGDVRVTLGFTFGEDGLIESVWADDRGRTVGDEVVPTRWEGRFWNYEQRDGMLVPLEAEVCWVLPSGKKPYWRGRLENLTYD